MNVHVTTGIRELTAQELDQVMGGVRAEVEQSPGVVAFALTSAGALVGIAVGALLDWLFG